MIHKNLLKMPAEERLFINISSLYPDQAEWLWQKLTSRLNEFRYRHPHLHENHNWFTQEDAILIVYGDQFQKSNESPLLSLFEFISDRLKNLITGVHILPIFPYSSDDGFSVIDYYSVDSHFGSWEDIEQIGRHYRLMVDAIINHVSSQSDWAQAFIQGKEPFTDYFITDDPSFDTSAVFRPRDHPLLTPVQTKKGLRYVWTTFSPDQFDLNFRNPQVLLEIIDVLLFYIEKGASIIRLDAIGYCWKESGTTCLNLPQAHTIVKIIRAALDIACPPVILITETNVPHEENIAYFGDTLTVRGEKDSRGDEAQLVYQFSLAPLVLHTFYASDVSAISKWLRELPIPLGHSTYLNFIASHDGIGVIPAKGLISDTEIQVLIDQTRKHGGLVSYRSNPDGAQSVYELNITLFDALNDPSNPDEELDIKRFIASQALMLSLAGVPAIYIHSLFGSRNCHDCVKQTGRARSINREKFDLEKLDNELHDTRNLKHNVFKAYRKLLEVRRTQPAFHPSAAQKVIESNRRVFCLLRQATDDEQAILCLINVSPEKQVVQFNSDAIGHSAPKHWADLLSNQETATSSTGISLTLEPYQAMWLAAKGQDEHP